MLVGAGMARFSGSSSRKIWTLLKGTLAAAMLTITALLARQRYLQLKLIWNPPPPVTVSLPDPSGATPPETSPAHGGSATASSQQPAATAGRGSEFTTGTRVRLKGLRSKPELNGQSGKVKSFDANKGRYNVVLATGGATLQVKASNLLEHVPQPSELSAQELIQMTLGDHSSLTPDHASRVIELLRSPNSPIEAGGLLRCCTCVKWHVPSVKAKKSGAIKFYVFSDTSNGSGFVLCSDPSRLVSVQERNPPPPGKLPAAQALSGKAIFNASTLEGMKFVSLDPEVGNTAEASIFTVLPEPYFQPLAHMSEAVCVEDGLKAIKGWCMAGCLKDALNDAAKLACMAFRLHTFFCFNATTDTSGQSILPITATGGPVTPGGDPALYMLLYTCEMVLEQARPHMQSLGAFTSIQIDPPACAVPGVDVLESLTAPGARNAGIHINEFVPGMNEDYKALGLTTEAVKRIFSAGGVAFGKGQGVTV